MFSLIGRTNASGGLLSSATRRSLSSGALRQMAHRALRGGCAGCPLAADCRSDPESVLGHDADGDRLGDLLIQGAGEGLQRLDVHSPQRRAFCRAQLIAGQGRVGVAEQGTAEPSSSTAFPKILSTACCDMVLSSSVNMTRNRSVSKAYHEVRTGAMNRVTVGR